ncbi:MAG: DUF362 domain-containing protein [Chloroflexi bacterium]|nr:DUF362 domain-containing protein [Chloroflexota bacterium]
MANRYIFLLGSVLALLHSHQQPAAGAELISAAGIATKRARVVIVQDAQATSAFNPQPEIIREMVRRGLIHLTGQTTPETAWRSLVSTQDLVGIKVFSSPGATSGTRPAVVTAVVQGLLSAGLPPRQILVWDKHLADLRAAGFFELAEKYAIRIAGSAEEGYDEAAYYETALLGRLVWGDMEFGRKGEGVGRKSFVSNLVTKKMTKIINITPLLNHNLAGVSGNLLGLSLGSVDNVLRFEMEPERLGTAIPEIYALPALGDRVVLNVVDALICQYEGEERSLLHYSTPLNQLRFSTDPLALDVLSLQELDRQRHATSQPLEKACFEIYQNASLLQIGISQPQNIKVEIVR